MNLIPLKRNTNKKLLISQQAQIWIIQVTFLSLTNIGDYNYSKQSELNYRMLNKTEGRKKNYLVDGSSQDFLGNKPTPNDFDSSLEESKESDSYSRKSDIIKRKMMRTVNPNRKFPKIAVDEESNAVLNARTELNKEKKRKTNLLVISKELEESIESLRAQINEVEKQKLKIRLERKGSRSDFSESKSDTRENGTQYLRTDHRSDGNKKIKNNVEKSLAVENSANEWLKRNEKLVKILL